MGHKSDGVAEWKPATGLSAHSDHTAFALQVLWQAMGVLQVAVHSIHVADMNPTILVDRQ